MIDYTISENTRAMMEHGIARATEIYRAHCKVRNWHRATFNGEAQQIGLDVGKRPSSHGDFWRLHFKNRTTMQPRFLRATDAPSRTTNE